MLLVLASSSELLSTASIRAKNRPSFGANSLNRAKCVNIAGANSLNRATR